MLKSLLFFLIFFYTYLNFWAQEKPTLFFRSITEKDGLSSNSMLSIAQDKYGFMWFGTNNGLNKYDGQKIMKYKAGNETILMDKNVIHEMVFDTANNLILNHGNSLSITNLDDRSKKHLIDTLSNVGLTLSKSGVLINHSKGVIKADGDINLWQNKILNLKISYDKKVIESYVRVYSFKNNYMAFTHNLIFLLDSNFKEIKRIEHKEKVFIQSLYIHDDFAYMFLWNSSIYKLNLKTFEISNLFKTNDDNVIAFNSTLWKYHGKDFLAIATSNGLLLYDLVEKIFYKYYDDIDAEIYAVYCDSSNNLWLGTSDKGVLMISNFQNVFTKIKVGQDAEGKYVWGLKNIDDNYFVSTRYNSGLYIYDKNWHLLNHTGKNSKYKNTIYNVDVLDCFDVQKKGKSYLCSGDFGIYDFNLLNQNVKFLLSYDYDIKLRDFVPINDDFWLVRAVGSGVYRYNHSRMALDKSYAIPKNNNTNFSTSRLKQLENGDIYLFTNNGHFKYDLKLDSFLKIDLTVLNKEFIRDVILDNNNNLWFSTDNGLYFYDSKKRKTDKYFDKDEDLNTALDKLVLYNDYLWGSNLNGFFCYNIKSKLLRKFDKSTGIMDIQEKRTFKTGPNETFACSGNDIFIINDSLFLNYKEQNELYFTSVSDGMNEYLKNIKDEIITFQPGLRNLFIKFVSPSFLAHNNMTYYYSSSGNDKWSKLENNELFLANLSHGTHEISVKAINKLTAEVSKHVKLTLILKPYWYQTTFFKLSFILINVCLLFLILWYYMNNQRIKMEKKKEIEQKIISMEMDNLRSQMNPHFLFNALNSINMYVVENETKLASDYLSKFSRLMRLILENSKHELITLTSEIESLDLYLLIESNRFDHSFSYTVNKLNLYQMDQIMLPPLIIQPFVENAIWHGLHHKKKDKKLMVDFKLDDTGNLLIITIEDNGIGREKAKDLNSKSITKSKSFGIESTTKRLLFLDKRNSIDIFDLEKDQKAIGTQVIIKYYIKD